MNVIYDSIYHHVPSTPSFQRQLTQDAAVPQSPSHCCLRSGYSVDLMVPTTPTYRTRRVHSTPKRDCWFMAPQVKTKTSTTTLNFKEKTQLSSLEFFKRFSEQVVPSTPLVQDHSSATPPGPGNVGTSPSRPTIKRRELARSRLVTTPAVGINLTAYENTRTQLNLFSGEDIFA